MGIFAIWAIFSGILLSSALIGGDDEESVQEDTDIDIDTDPVVEDPDILLDTGATFQQT